MFLGKFRCQEIGQDQFWTMVPFLINGTITYAKRLAFYENYFENNVSACNRNTHL